MSILKNTCHYLKKIQLDFLHIKLQRSVSCKIVIPLEEPKFELKYQLTILQDQFEQEILCKP